MNIVLYSCSADNRQLDKSKKLTIIDKLENVNLKEDTSIMNPTLVLNLKAHSKLRKCNYIYIPDFGRYYFIRNIIEKIGRVFEVSCHIDVLQTYHGDIKEITALILRQENINNPYIEDGELLVRSTRTFEKINIGKVGDSTDHYYLTVNNGGRV